MTTFALGTWDTRYPLRSELLSYAALQTANYTASAFEFVPFDLSGASANVTLEFPASPSVGDEVGGELILGHATHNLILDTNGEPFRGGTSDIRYFDLCLPGDHAVFKFYGGTWGWDLAVDRIKLHEAQIGRVSGSSAQSLTVNGGLTTIQFDTLERQIGCGVDLPTESITPRRKARYEAAGQVQVTGLADQSRVQAQIAIAGAITATRAFPESPASYNATTATHSGGSHRYELAASVAITLKAQVVNQAVAGSPALGAGSFLALREVRG